MREEAEKLVQALQALKRPSIKEAQDELDRKTVEAWKKAHPRRRKVPDIFKVRQWEGVAPLFDEALKDLHSRQDEYDAAKEKIESQIKALIEQGCKPLPGDHEVRTHIAWSSTYSSQGYGSVKYARNDAEMNADKARYLDLPVRVEEIVPDGSRKGYPQEKDFEVWVQVQDPVVDPVLLKLSPGPSLVESVRLCWKRGVNPRVFNPYLPHGFEEKHGLDYFGNYKNSEKTPKSA